MKKEISCGAILYTVEDGKRQYVLIMEANGSYGFPKGHKRYNETEMECALREIKEETGVDAEFIEGYKRTISYVLPYKNTKEVTYFLAKYENQDLIPQDKGILAAKKFDLETALSLIKFNQVNDILVEMDYILDLKGL